MSDPSASFVHRNLPRLLLEAREAVMQHTRPSLREHGLSDQQWRVLRVLGEHAGDPAGVETGRVAREALLLGPSLTGVLTRMERDGLISRGRCPQDARRTVVRATRAGLKLVATLSQTIEAHYAWMEEQLGKAQLARLYTLLDQVIALEAPVNDEPTEEENP
ncbi:MAG TPA: homoprotocatechuate degradation operon regulator HpaR [Hydrogenophaga sp.]|uniref:homoprotocatechuate degradation operon regulator HpaR n=1 Tax=Hydrogenophaga sp. TaxID=1904254 RepID=UPI0008D47731|nr:homoprotocatechuate degradation operon regulator HpaR [Hydrogenophaga sp.]OGA78270.1 MAG: homoprotocatechuate degradation operon regulator, HpaR [Burkholderiales bacterium GWE1_65_30]OGA93116.1 MAG: homoprotocatechuate degradation operon regulator, HpaR [Burkholderiales bacterium GWF1_66_17]HAX19232.1 homoprotocatechuate degradation operon regulator HpaR [Hydrogenophaga sp.]HBU18429.1 homoprotocatechuate degradation operon regulator HpaR [Hydrogenophaga sp.]